MPAVFHSFGNLPFDKVVKVRAVPEKAELFMKNSKLVIEFK